MDSKAAAAGLSEFLEDNYVEEAEFCFVENILLRSNMSGHIISKKDLLDISAMDHFFCSLACLLTNEVSRLWDVREKIAIVFVKNDNIVNAIASRINQKNYIIIFSGITFQIFIQSCIISDIEDTRAMFGLDIEKARINKDNYLYLKYESLPIREDEVSNIMKISMMMLGNIVFHELHHHLAGHIILKSKRAISDDECAALEYDADCFAATGWTRLIHGFVHTSKGKIPALLEKEAKNLEGFSKLSLFSNISSYMFEETIGENSLVNKLESFVHLPAAIRSILAWLSLSEYNRLSKKCDLRSEQTMLSEVFRPALKASFFARKCVPTYDQILGDNNISATKKILEELEKRYVLLRPELNRCRLSRIGKLA